MLASWSLMTSQTNSKHHKRSTKDPSSINTPNQHLITHKSCNLNKIPKFTKLGFKPNFPKSNNIIHVQKEKKRRRRKRIGSTHSIMSRVWVGCGSPLIFLPSTPFSFFLLSLSFSSELQLTRGVREREGF